MKRRTIGLELLQEHEETEAPEFRWNAAPALLSHLRDDLLTHVAEDPTGAATPIDPQFRTQASRALQGFAAYRAHPYARSTVRARVYWQSGTTRLLDMGGEGPPVLLIPSLINRADILDLMPGDSRARWLAAQGFRVFLIDWGAPGEAEMAFRIGNYIADRILPIIEVIRRACDGAGVGLVGYCMGGVMALGAASLAPSGVCALVTVGAPWECSALPDLHQVVRNRDQIDGTLVAMGATFRAVPAQVAQNFFAMRDPAAAVRKFRSFAGGEQDRASALRFVAVEDWLNSGEPLTVGAARECFVEWFVDNALAKGTWRIDDGVFDPSSVRCPVKVVVGRKDRVVPPDVAAPLAAVLPQGDCLQVDLGHLGLVMGEDGTAQVWQPIAAFLAEQACAGRGVA